MTDKPVQLLLIGKGQLEFSFVLVNQGKFIAIYFNGTKFVWLEGLPGQKCRIHKENIKGQGIELYSAGAGT